MQIAQAKKETLCSKTKTIRVHMQLLMVCQDRSITLVSSKNCKTRAQHNQLPIETELVKDIQVKSNSASTNRTETRSMSGQAQRELARRAALHFDKNLPKSSLVHPDHTDNTLRMKLLELRTEKTSWSHSLRNRRCRHPHRTSPLMLKLVSIGSTRTALEKS